MTPDEIKAATDTGTRLLRFNDSKLKIGSSIGLVLNPSLRLAAATRAFRAGHGFAGPELQPVFRENLWWVLAYPEVVYESHPTVDYAIVGNPDRVSRIWIRGGKTTGSTMIFPVWTASIVGDCEVAVMSAMFGGRVKQGAGIAAFPADAFQAGHEIVVVYTEVSNDHRRAQRSKIHKIAERDLRNWR